MKRISHWTPRYLCHRLVRYFFEKDHPSCPNLAIGAVQFLDHYLKNTDMFLEYGSGYSTAWFAQRVGRIISIENDMFWHEKVKSQISGYSNAEIHLFDSKTDVVPGSCVSWDYVNKMNEFAPQFFDVILNDGYARLQVSFKALPLLKPGCIFIWDDWANLWPVSTHIPWAKPTNTVVKNPEIRQFYDIVKDWRQVCFDDDTHSTAIFFKPLSSQQL